MGVKSVRTCVWDDHYRLWDTGVAALAWAATWYYGHSHTSWLADCLSGERATLYGTIATIFGALLGFVITSFSIVIGFMSNDRVVLLRSSGPGKKICGVFIWGAFCVAFAAASPLIGLVFDRGPWAKPWMCALLVGTSLVGAGALIRCLRILEAVSNSIMSTTAGGSTAS
jgi:hypothetical protein